MSEDELSPALRQFLSLAVHNFEELETLVLLKRTAEHLTAQGVQSRLGLSQEYALAALEHLVAHGVLRASAEEPTTYAFDAHGRYASLVDDLSRAYSQQRLAVVSAISSNAIVRVRTSAIRTFAEAFKFRKGGKTDG